MTPIRFLYVFSVLSRRYLGAFPTGPLDRVQRTQLCPLSAPKALSGALDPPFLVNLYIYIYIFLMENIILIEENKSRKINPGK